MEAVTIAIVGRTDAYVGWAAGLSSLSHTLTLAHALSHIHMHRLLYGMFFFFLI
jgi:hypothetical protein